MSEIEKPYARLDNIILLHISLSGVCTYRAPKFTGFGHYVLCPHGRGFEVGLR